MEVLENYPRVKGCQKLLQNITTYFYLFTKTGDNALLIVKLLAMAYCHRPRQLWNDTFLEQKISSKKNNKVFD